MRDDKDPVVAPAPRRAMAAGITAAGVPAAGWLLRPGLGQAVILLEAVVVFAVLGTALYGSLALSERAFRLLRWIRNSPEPPAAVTGPPPDPGLPGQGRGQAGSAPVKAEELPDTGRVDASA